MTISIDFCQFNRKTVLSEENLKEIASLIYDTDPYIYPSLFSSRENACIVLPEVFASGNDAMFNLENTFAAINDRKVVGLILWKKGPLLWDPKALMNAFANHGIEIPYYFEHACQNYLMLYKKCPKNTVSLYNVCVSKMYRGNAVGTALMRAFIEKHSGESLELYVLDENMPAKRLYLSAGFKYHATIDGYAVDDKKPVCLIMNLTSHLSQFTDS